MRGDLEALRPSGFGVVSHPKNWGLYVKESVLSKLSRYETAIERSLYKALHELQRLQAARGADGNAPPPVAIDVDVSGVSRHEH